MCASCSVVSGCLQPHGLYLPGSSVHGILQARRLEWVLFPSPGDLPNLALLKCRQILYCLSHREVTQAKKKKKIHRRPLGPYWLRDPLDSLPLEVRKKQFHMHFENWKIPEGLARACE